MAAAFESPPAPSLQRGPGTVDPTPILIPMLDHVQRYFRDELEGGITTHADHPESWAFVGMDTQWALTQLGFARSQFRENSAPAFLDCGAGLGFIGMLARGLGFEPAGIELSPRYVEIARRLFPWAQVREGDVLTFPNYARQDVIFYYGPFKDDLLQERFELKVEAEAKSGAIIIANRKVSSAWMGSPRFQMLAQDGLTSWIFRKC
jgi:hypothetical protein